MLRDLALGAAAGAAGTTALNAVTYADMVLRARPASSTPETTVERLADDVPGDVPGEGEDRTNRVSALGALTGIASGVAVGVAYGALRGAGVRLGVPAGALVTTVGALAGTNGPMAALGVSDPRAWDADSWVTDVVPHIAYGAVTAAVFAAFDR